MFKRLTPLILFLNIFFECSPQTRTLQGKVVDRSGRAIAFASISFKGFSYGTKTDKNGNYTAIISEKYDSIVCTHVNYKRMSEKIEGNTVINLVMERITLPATTLLVDTILASGSSSSLTTERGTPARGDKYFEKVEIFAGFPGGEKAFQQYLKNKILDSLPGTFPKVKGVVKYGFNISGEGIPKDFILLKGIDKSIDDYVLQVLSRMPKWVPAIQNGMSVEQYREAAISFYIH
jgi:hypothetical protein